MAIDTGHDEALSEEVLLANPWRRVAARAIDSLAVFWVMFALVVVHAAFWVPIWSEDVTPEPWAKAFLATLTFAVFLVVYEVVFVTARGQTPGKDVMQVKVVRAGDAGPPSAAQALARSLVQAALWMVPTVWIAIPAQLVTGITVPATRRRRSIADLVAGTEVVHYEHPEGPPKLGLWDRPRSRMALRRLRGR